MPLIKLNIRLILRRLQKISSIKLSAIAASLEKEVEIVVGLYVKSVCGTPHPSRKLDTFSSRRRRKPFMPYYIRNRIIANNFTLLLDFRKNQLTNRLLSAKIMGLKNSGPIWLRFPIQFNTESCPSGRRCSTRNAVYVKYLGFESLTLRHRKSLETAWFQGFSLAFSQAENGLFVRVIMSETVINCASGDIRSQRYRLPHHQ